MGADKAFLEIAGESLLARSVGLLRQELDDVRVSVSAAQAGDERWQGYPLIEDQFAGIGPAAGLLSAHMVAPDSAWLVLACDMPLVDAATISRLIVARDPDKSATAWAGEDGRGPEPLCAIYEPATLAAFMEQVSAGRNVSPRAWLASAKVNLLQLSTPGCLDGANTPEEFSQLSGKLEAE